MNWEPRKPQRLGAERREAEQRIVEDIAMMSAGAIRESPVQEHAERKSGAKCPECGSAKYVPQDGCWLCLECGYSPCGVH